MQRRRSKQLQLGLPARSLARRDQFKGAPEVRTGQKLKMTGAR